MTRRRYDRIMERLDAGWPYEEVAKEFNTQVNVIAVYDKARTGTLTVIDREPGTAAGDERIREAIRLIKEKNWSIADMYRAGFYISEIAKLRGKTQGYISYVLEKEGVKLCRQRTMAVPTAEQIEEGVRLIESGMSMYAVEHELGVNHYYLADACTKRGIRYGGRLKRITESQWQEAMQMYRDGMNLEKLGLYLGTAAARVSAEFKRRGITLKKNGKV